MSRISKEQYELLENMGMDMSAYTTNEPVVEAEPKAIVEEPVVEELPMVIDIGPPQTEDKEIVESELKSRPQVENRPLTVSELAQKETVQAHPEMVGARSPNIRREESRRKMSPRVVALAREDTVRALASQYRKDRLDGTDKEIRASRDKLFESLDENGSLAGQKTKTSAVSKHMYDNMPLDDAYDEALAETLNAMGLRDVSWGARPSTNVSTISIDPEQVEDMTGRGALIDSLGRQVLSTPFEYQADRAEGKGEPLGILERKAPVGGTKETLFGAVLRDTGLLTRPLVKGTGDSLEAVWPYLADLANFLHGTNYNRENMPKFQSKRTDQFGGSYEAKKGSWLSRKTKELAVENATGRMLGDDLYDLTLWDQWETENTNLKKWVRNGAWGFGLAGEIIIPTPGELARVSGALSGIKSANLGPLVRSAKIAANENVPLKKVMYTLIRHPKKAVQEFENAIVEKAIMKHVDYSIIDKNKRYSQLFARQVGNYKDRQIEKLVREGHSENEIRDIIEIRDLMREKFPTLDDPFLSDNSISSRAANIIRAAGDNTPSADTMKKVRNSVREDMMSLTNGSVVYVTPTTIVDKLWWTDKGQKKVFKAIKKDFDPIITGDSVSIMKNGKRVDVSRGEYNDLVTKITNEYVSKYGRGVQPTREGRLVTAALDPAEGRISELWNEKSILQSFVRTITNKKPSQMLPPRSNSIDVDNFGRAFNERSGNIRRTMGDVFSWARKTRTKETESTLDVVLQNALGLKPLAKERATEIGVGELESAIEIMTDNFFGASPENLIPLWRNFANQMNIVPDGATSIPASAFKAENVALFFRFLERKVPTMAALSKKGEGLVSVKKAGNADYFAPIMNYIVKASEDQIYFEELLRVGGPEFKPTEEMWTKVLSLPGFKDLPIAAKKALMHMKNDKEAWDTALQNQFMRSQREGRFSYSPGITEIEDRVIVQGKPLEGKKWATSKSTDPFLPDIEEAHRATERLISRILFEPFKDEIQQWMVTHGMTKPTNFEDLTNIIVQHGRPTISESVNPRYRAGKVESLIDTDEDVTRAVRDNVKWLTAKGVDVPDVVDNVNAFSIKGIAQGLDSLMRQGLLGGKWSPNFKYLTQNILTAPLIISMTTPGYMKKAMAQVPGLARKGTAEAVNYFDYKFTQKLRRLLMKPEAETSFMSRTGHVYNQDDITDLAFKHNIGITQSEFELREVAEKLGESAMLDIRRVAGDFMRGEYKNLGLSRADLDYILSGGTGIKHNLKEKGVDTMQLLLDTLNPRRSSIWTNFANESDMFFRKSVFIAALKDGKTPEVAAQMAREALLDYGAIPQYMKDKMSKVLLFSSFFYKMNEAVLNGMMSVKGRTAILRNIRLQNLMHKSAGSYVYSDDRDKARIYSIAQGVHANGMLPGSPGGRELKDKSKSSTYQMGYVNPVIETLGGLVNVAGAGLGAVAHPSRIGSSKAVGAAVDVLQRPEQQLFIDLARGRQKSIPWRAATRGTALSQIGNDGIESDSKIKNLLQPVLQPIDNYATKDVSEMMTNAPDYKLGRGQPTFGGERKEFASREEFTSWRIGQTIAQFLGIRRLVDDLTSAAVVAGGRPAGMDPNKYGPAIQRNIISGGSLKDLIALLGFGNIPITIPSEAEMEYNNMSRSVQELRGMGK